MTDKILDLADNFATTKARYWCHHEGVTHQDMLQDREKITAAIKAEQDYARAVISERDALKENFEAQQEYTRVAAQELCHLEKERDALHSERDELKALMHKALDERDHFIRERDGLCAARMAYASEFQCDADGLPDVGSVHQNIRALKAERDKLTMVHAERTVERDRLRKVAQMALYADDHFHEDEDSHIAAFEELRKELGA